VVLGRRGMQDVDNETLIKSFEHLIRKIQKSGLKDGQPMTNTKKSPTKGLK
ncbi:MAG: ribonuclease P protein component, partial [Hydrogenovibrio crunogenus]|nr:ribonuclease P protein component [Hydrogenovibrio crunogenus]